MPRGENDKTRMKEKQKSYINSAAFSSFCPFENNRLLESESSCNLTFQKTTFKESFLREQLHFPVNATVGTNIFLLLKVGVRRCRGHKKCVGLY